MIGLSHRNCPCCPSHLYRLRFLVLYPLDSQNHFRRVCSRISPCLQLCPGRLPCPSADRISHRIFHSCPDPNSPFLLYRSHSFLPSLCHRLCRSFPKPCHRRTW